MVKKILITKREIFEACKKAHCDEFIKKFPKGINETIGEKGVKLIWWSKTKNCNCKSFF